jgi:Domain of unknown function (DUF4429)/Short C-terminal domain
MKIESGDRKVSMEIVGDSVIISSSGANVMIFRGMQGQRSIPIRSITSVQVKLGTTFFPGYINLSYPGGKEFQGGLAAAAADPDTLIFNRKTNAEVEKFAAEINRLRASLQSRPILSTADEIAKLVELHENGTLSDEEFAMAKRKVLGS